jgi:hypothetical protein
MHIAMLCPVMSAFCGGNCGFGTSFRKIQREGNERYDFGLAYSFSVILALVAGILSRRVRAVKGLLQL